MREVLEIINFYNSAVNIIGDRFAFLQENGYSMHLICRDHPDLKNFAEKQGIKCQPIYLKRDSLSILSDFKAFIQVCKYIEHNHIDTVIAHQAKARLIGISAAYFMKVPNRIIFAHGVLYETMSGAKRWIIKTIDKVVAAMSTKVICVSPSVARVRARDGINKPSKNYLLNIGTCGGIDTKELFNPERYTNEQVKELGKMIGIKEDDFVIGFCGRMVRDKGISELIDGFKLLQLEYIGQKIKLLIIGSNEIRDSIPDEVKTIIQTDENIIFTGRVPHKDMGLYYMQMDVLVLPSYREGFGMVTIEAAAMGVPAVVSRSTGCVDSICENKTGIYSDIDALAIKDAISKFLDKGFRDSLARNCRKYVVDSYDHSVVWPSLLEIIGNI